MLRFDGFDDAQRAHCDSEPIPHFLGRGLGKLKPVNHLENYNFYWRPWPQTSLYSAIQPAQVLPRITILIPLLEEPRILHHLLYHFQRLDYPRTHLEVMLILKDGDAETQTALLTTKLPSW